MSRTWDHKITLVSVNIGINENGFQETTYVENEESIYANKLNVFSSEFWAAKQNLISLEHVFEIHDIEFNGERAVKYDDSLFKIERTYLNKDGYLELTLSAWSDDHGIGN